MRSFPGFKQSQWNGAAIAAIVLLALSFLLGGASRQHELRLALVELAALPLLAFGLISIIRQTPLPVSRLAIGILAAAAALPLLQLIPLPPGLWTALPGRTDAALALEVGGLAPGWVPLTLTPDRTWASFLAILPPVAMFLGVIACRGEFRGTLVLLLLIFSTAAVLLGAVQLASGTEVFYPWRTTDAGNLVGFFANRNHMATLCLICIPFATALGASGRQEHGAGDQRRVWLSALFVGLVIVILAATRSRTGIVLAAPVLGASLLAAWVAAGRGRPRPLLLVSIVAGTAAFLAVGIFAIDPILQRFEGAQGQEGRFRNWPIIAQAAQTYSPLGSGSGSFDPVFRSVEPLATLDPTFYNQAHNDYLEIWLEVGYPGVILMLAFLIWYVRRTWAAWGAKATRTRDLQRAASIAIGAVLLHSAVDYPLRTESIAVIFALCCALLELGRRVEGMAEDAVSPSRSRRHKPARRRT